MHPCGKIGESGFIDYLVLLAGARERMAFAPDLLATATISFETGRWTAMTKRLQRSINEPIREGLGTEERWSGRDRGLVWCWERGRQIRAEEPGLAARAESGELVMLVWKGGVEKKLDVEKKPGSLNYLATWQGLRGVDLDIELQAEHDIVCTKTGQIVTFGAKLPAEDE